MEYTCQYGRLSIDDRIKRTKNLLNKRMLETIQRKKTCICLAVDFTRTAEVLKTVEKAAAYVFAVKVHVDILEDFSEQFTKQLIDLSVKYDFLIIEDRKFADTGNTVELQMTSGIYKISQWANLVTIHALPGQPILDTLRRVSGKQNSTLKGCLLVAEMSTRGSLTGLKGYPMGVVELASENCDIVCGFICQNRVSRNDSFLYWTAGVNMVATTDGSGQRWRTIEKAIVEDGNDIIIVGRALTESANFERDIVGYRNIAWESLCHAIDINKTTYQTDGVDGQHLFH